MLYSLSGSFCNHTQSSAQPIITADGSAIPGSVCVCLRARCLDAVCKLLQSFGSNGFHGGDERGQLVLGACRRSLQHTKTGSVLAQDHLQRPAGTPVGGPAGWSRTPTCSSSGVGGWGRWSAPPNSHGAWWPCEPLTQCCLPPASGCLAPPVDKIVSAGLFNKPELFDQYYSHRSSNVK